MGGLLGEGSGGVLLLKAELGDLLLQQARSLGSKHVINPELGEGQSSGGDHDSGDLLSLHKDLSLIQVLSSR